MTSNQHQNIAEVIREALRATVNAPTMAVVEWIEKNNSAIYKTSEEAAYMLKNGWADAVRRFRKASPATDDDSIYVTQLFEDLGIEKMPLDKQISIPLDLDNLTYGPCEWKELAEDATIDDISLHVLWLDAQVDRLKEKASYYRKLIQEAVAQSPGGRTNITMRELRNLRRQRN